ncbi:MAG: MBL fold metallo-hydrolase [Rhodobacteraceae bacterium]|nr:MBL fold metallo-hydrolase [Paracoccaceae bacterium]MCF8513066.1 MBL fold metallo-hydrolase [Paracoccaceae bacterium]MCF8517310.1 MBL fold metallo-hydrolase [Paracoccaceae bacterium]
MNRRRFFKGATLLAALGAAGGATSMAISTSRNRYYAGPKSDHFDGLRFFNPGGTPPRGLPDLLKWQFEGGRAKWPAQVPLAATAKPAAREADLTITMVGHATMLVQIAGLNLLTDPVWSDRASPLAFAGPRRVTAPGIAFADLPKIDAVLLSHNHYDHLDIATLRTLHAQHNPEVITPIGNDAILRDAIPEMRITTGDWGHATPFGPLTVHFEPCHHWSARGMGDRSMALWAAFVIDSPVGKLLHIGDTGFDEGRPYRDLPQKHGRIRAGILPIGAYEPRWFMQAQHQNPEEAVEGFLLAGLDHAVGHHWGTFQLTNEGREAPVVALEQALVARKIAAERFVPLAPGQVWAAPVV